MADVAGLVIGYNMRIHVLWITICCCFVIGHAASDKGPRFVLEPESTVVKEHGKLVLHCRAEPKSAVIRWKYNGRYITSDPDRGVDIQGGRLHVASFKHRKRDASHAGIYQCTANTTEGIVVSKEAKVEKAVLSHFPDDLSDIYINVTEGNVAVVPCPAPRSNPEPSFTFEVNGTGLDILPNRMLVLPSGSLQIAEVRPSDQGNYRCHVFNTVSGHKRKSPIAVHLRVAAPMAKMAPNIVQNPPENIEVVKGKNLTLECVVEGSPVPVVTWDKYGGVLPEGRYHQIFGNLVIHHASNHDSGTYICRAANEVGQPQSAVAKVEVLEPPVAHIVQPQSVSEEGSTVTLQCNSRGEPRVKTEWLRDTEEVFNDNYITVSDTSLTISNLQPKHSGMYQCVARSRIGMSYATAKLLVVTRGNESKPTEGLPPSTTDEQRDGASERPFYAPKPKLTVFPVNTTAEVGGTIILSCAADNQSDLGIQINWLKGEKPVGYLTMVEVGSGGSRASRFKEYPEGALEIEGVTADDAGLYTCIATNSGGYDRGSAFLTVSGKKDLKPSDETKGSASPRTPVATSGHQRPRASGHNTTASRPRKTGRKKRPNKDRGRRRKKGKAREKIKKKEGKESKKPTNGNGHRKIELQPPSRPEVTKVSDTSVRLSWRLPQKNGLGIRFLKLQYKEVSAERRRRQWRTADDEFLPNIRRHELKDLKTGAVYKFRVLAVFSNLDNRWSDSSRKFTLEAENASSPRVPVAKPVIVQAKSMSVSTISIHWLYTPLDHSQIEGFQMHYKPYDDKDAAFKLVIIPGAEVREKTIDRLQADTSYTFYMTCFNSAGNSKESNKVTHTTKSYGDKQITLFPPNFSVVRQASSTPQSQLEEYSDPSHSTQSSSEMLYMILGIVLGVMMLLLIVFMVMCAWKQRQQRRMMAAIECRHKFHDPAKAIYVDSLRKKQMNGHGPFMLNGLNSRPVTNGHIPNHFTNGGSRVNINVNPMTDLDPELANTDNSKPTRSTQDLQDLRTSLQEILRPAPTAPPSGNHCCSDRESNCNSINRSAQAQCDSDASTENLNYRDPMSMSTFHPKRTQTGDTDSPGGVSNPPDYYSLNSIAFRPSNQVAYRASPDHIPRSHETLPYRSHDPIRSVQDETRDQLSEHSFSSSSQVSGKHKRRRRRTPSRDCNTRDQSTNTDLSSNEGTLDHPPCLPCRSREPSVREDSPPGNLPTPPVYPNYPRAQDYPPSDHED